MLAGYVCDMEPLAPSAAEDGNESLEGFVVAVLATRPGSLLYQMELGQTRQDASECVGTRMSLKGLPLPRWHQVRPEERENRSRDELIGSEWTGQVTWSLEC